MSLYLNHAMDEKKLQDQIEQLDDAIHRVTYGMKVRHSEDVRNLSPNEMVILSMVTRKPDLILKEIRDCLKVPQTTLSSIVARLEKMDLVKRVINRRDLRSFSIEVTEKGKKMAEEHKYMDQQIARDLLEALEEEERCQYVYLMRKLASKLGIKMCG